MGTPVRKILVALDLGPAADAVAAWAVNLARDLGATLVALTIVEGMEKLLELNLPYVRYDELIPAEVERARKRLEKFASHALQGARPLELVACHGEPDVEILRVARETAADMVVMGTHGRTGLARAVFGSSAQRVVERSAVPVVVVPVVELGGPVGGGLAK